MAKLALLVATLALVAPESLSHNLGAITDRQGHVTVATRTQPPQASSHEIGNARRYLHIDRISTANTATSDALIYSADPAHTSTMVLLASSILDRFPTVQQASQATDSIASSRRRLISSSTPVSSSADGPVSSGSSAAAQDEDPFSIFDTPAGESSSSDGSATDSSSSSFSASEDSSGDGAAIFESGDSMQQPYDTITWSTTYFNSSDDASTSIIGSTSGAAEQQQQQQQSDQSTTSNTAAVTQELGQYIDTTAAGNINQTLSGNTTNLTRLESAQVSLPTPEAQDMYDSTMASVESPADGTEYTNISVGPLPPTAEPRESDTSQGQYNSLPQASNTSSPDNPDTLESNQLDRQVSGDSGVQASTSGFDPSAGVSADKGSVVGGAAVSTSATDPQPLTVSAANISEESLGSSSTSASVNTSGNTRSSAWVFSESPGNSLTLESLASQQAVHLAPGPAVDSNPGMSTYQVMILPLVPVTGQQQQHQQQQQQEEGGTGEPNSTRSSSWVALPAPGSAITTQAINSASLKWPIKLGVGADASAGLRDSNSYDVTTVGNGGAHLGPGVITGVGVSLAGVFVVALGVTIWYRNKRQKLKNSDVRKARHGILKTWGTIPPRAGQNIAPVVVATAENASNKAYSPVGSPMRTSPRCVYTIGTQTVSVTSQPEPTPGANVRWFT